jgi:hypothetical protein
MRTFSAMLPYLSIVIATSGHIRAQFRQAMHASWSIHFAGWYPFWLISSKSRAMMPSEHTPTQRPHPLQKLLSTITRVIDHPLGEGRGSPFKSRYQNLKKYILAIFT